MAIDDPRAIKFINETLRPLAEKTRALGAEYLAAATAWQVAIGALVPNDTTPVDDGREAEGVSRLTGADVNTFMGMLLALREGGNQGAVERLCVRPLQAT